MFGLIGKFLKVGKKGKNDISTEKLKKSQKNTHFVEYLGIEHLVIGS